MKESASRVVILTTAASTLRTFFVAQIQFLESVGFVVHSISAPSSQSGGADAPQLPTHPVAMQRSISPLADLAALGKIYRLLRRIRPQLVHTHTPKAGLLGMIAARIAGVSVRIYTVNGLVWITSTGFQRRLLMLSERLACALATDVIAVSASLQRIVVEMGICPPQKIRVLGSGGSHGVDPDRFDPVQNSLQRSGVRDRFGIPEDACIVIFVGRLVRQKGIEELAIAWRQLRNEFLTVHLLLCGEFEHRDSISPEILASLRECSRVHFTSAARDEIPAFYAASDICVLPTWREGLPNVALEAAAMEKPIVATRVTGCVDAIMDGVTGLLVEPRNPESLAIALRRMLNDDEMRVRMGREARRFVTERFSESRMSRRLLEEYQRLLGTAPAESGL